MCEVDTALFMMFHLDNVVFKVFDVFDAALFGDVLCKVDTTFVRYVQTALFTVSTFGIFDE